MAAAFSFGHGMNDAQKTMGIIFALLLSTGHLGGSHVPIWIVLMCHAAIGLGTLSGGWRIIRTMSMRITPLKPVGAWILTIPASALVSALTWKAFVYLRN